MVEVIEDHQLGVRVELIIHLGFLKNIDLWTQGVYCVKISLMAGKDGTLISPIGTFSAPSHLESYVGFQRVCYHDHYNNDVKRIKVIEYFDKNC